MSLRPFHLAIRVNDLDAARAFYGGVLGCNEGRSDHQWVDFNLFGHQLVCHLDSRNENESPEISNLVDGHGVPVPHFGVVLDMKSWTGLRDRLVAARTCFLIEPSIRFKGQAGEQATMFFRDPAGNALEMKAFEHIESLFARS